MEKPDCDKTAEEIQSEILQDVPERCRDCPMLGQYALRYAQLRLNQQLSLVTGKALERLMFPRSGNRCPSGVTPEGACGSLDYPR